ncbi:type I phosphomannose isomerase catalytic subunit, partial [Flavobacterium sp. XS1P32]
MKLYPLQFDPIFKERIWGGEKLKTLLKKPITSTITGESWELSTVEGDVSVVANGAWKGKSLTTIIDDAPVEILGTEVYARFGKQFPLLFKYLDAREDLSIQVHPNDELAKKRHHSFGKTEMWYIMQADDDARIIVGFKEKSNATEYLENLKNKTLLSILDDIKVKSGDVFFLETGTVHAIGAGLVVAEIQQTSDITYRLYDFDRLDANGNTRELHVDLALEAINYDKVETKKEYTKKINCSNEIVECPYFTTNFIPLDGQISISKSAKSFTVYMCTE